MFRIDWWLDRGPLEERCPHLFAICSGTSVTIEKPRNLEHKMIWFRITFVLDENVEWHNMSRNIKKFQWSDQPNVITWSLEAPVFFSSSSVYWELCRGSVMLYFWNV
jgi:hypothetical protein